MKFLRNILDSVEPQFTGDGKLKKFYPVYEMIDTFLFTPSSQTKSAPYVRDSIDLKRSMVFVVLALLPCFLFGIYNVAHQVNPSADFLTKLLNGAYIVLPIYAVVFTVGGICELLFALIRGHEINEGFLVTGFLIPLCLPQPFHYGWLQLQHFLVLL